MQETNRNPFFGLLPRYISFPDITTKIDELSVAQLHKITRLRIILSIATVYAFLILVSLFSQNWFQRGVPEELSLRALIAFLFIALIFYVSKSHNLKFGNWALNIFFLISIPYRLYTTGGISPVIGEYIVFSIFNFALNGMIAGSVSLAWSIISVTIFSVLELMDLIPNASAVKVEAELAFSLLLVTFPAFFILQENRILLKKSQNLEKIKSAYLVMERINHEIGNSLQIALVHVGAYDIQIKDLDLDKAKKQLLEVDKLIKAMGESAHKGNLTDLLEKHRKTIYIRFFTLKGVTH